MKLGRVANIAHSIGLAAFVSAPCASCESDFTSSAMETSERLTDDLQPASTPLAPPPPKGRSPSEGEKAAPTVDRAATPSDDAELRRFRLESIRGKVVWLNEALQERFGISTVTEASERSLAILSETGQVLPLVDDARGRAFRVDERLREMDVELLVRRYEGHPLLQVIRVFEVVDGNRYEVDYWCDVCSIVMIQQGPCACCQDANRLRKRLVPP